MTTYNDEGLSARILAGDESSVDEARRRYNANPEANLVGWISTLYSFQANPVCRAELRGYAKLVYEKASKLVSELHQTPNHSAANDADTVSTVLVWMASQSDFHDGLVRRPDMLLAAKDLAKAGLQVDFWPGHHTPVLLRTTLVQLEHNSKRANGHLEQAARLALDVDDRNQRVRCLKRVGWLYIKERHIFRGLKYLHEAFKTKDVPRNVKAKIFRR